ncbi:hypothetical protein ACFFK0_24245 [Paenibacillus chartarius]|uniref:Uncharacterized protein n=1 Tax=Paenibacillus chartarius TaxID=747481 RepID=A0ABV6DS99_9BACL
MRNPTNPWSFQGGKPPGLAVKAKRLMGQPAGISLINGQGVSGVICNVDRGQVEVLQYLYGFQFATFHYALDEIADILPFPNCRL